MALTKATLIDLNANELILDLDADTSITADSDDTIHIKIGGSDEIIITGTALSPSTSDGNALGTSALEWSDLFLADGAVINFGDDQDVSLTHVADTGLLLSSTDQLQFGDSGTYIHQSADGVLDLVSDTEIEINATTIDMNGALDVSGTITSGGVITGTAFTAGSAVLTEAELETLDGVTVGTAIASKVVTTDANIDTTGQRNLTISGELDAATGDFSGDVDIDGTANLDTVDIDGATQIDATVTVGVDDTGYDVKFFGATSGAHLLWDESVDDLILAGAARVVVPEGNLVLGSTAVTSTAAELNLLDGVSGLVQADLTKLAAVDSTAAELNIVDGGTSATSTTVADADRVVMNDNGTMVQVAVTDLAAYFDDEITAMPNLTSVGTLTALTVDDVAIDGKVMTMTGSSGDTFVTTVAANGATSLVTTDASAAAANLTITADGTVGINSTGDMTLDSSADIILDADGADIVFKDGGTTIATHSNSSSDYVITTGVQDKDFVIKGDDGGSAITPLTIDMSAGGDLFLTGGLIDLKNNGSNVSQIKFYCESSNAHAQTLIGAPHSESATNTLTLPSTGGNSYLVTAASTATLTNKTLTAPVINGGVVFNEDSADVDFRVESNDDANMFVVDAGNNRIGVGTATPSVNLHIVQDASEGTPTYAGATHFAVQATASSSDNVNASLISGSAGVSRLFFGDKDDEDIGKIEYNNSTNAMSINTNTATAMTIDSIGAVTKPLQPAFNVNLSADQSNLAINGRRTIEFDTERFDVNADFNTGTYTFTAPVTGKYQLNFSAQLDHFDGSSNFVGFHIETSNDLYMYYHHIGGSANANADGSGGGALSCLADMDANDTAFCSIYQHAGAAQLDVVYTGTSFNGILIG